MVSEAGVRLAASAKRTAFSLVVRNPPSLRAQGHICDKLEPSGCIKNVLWHDNLLKFVLILSRAICAHILPSEKALTALKF